MATKSHQAPIRRRYVTVDEAAEYLGVCTRTLRRAVARGDLTERRLPGSKVVRIDLDELDRVLVGGASA